jgi:hypothetical protein
VCVCVEHRRAKERAPYIPSKSIAPSTLGGISNRHAHTMIFRTSGSRRRGQIWKDSSPDLIELASVHGIDLGLIWTDKIPRPSIRVRNTVVVMVVNLGGCNV